MEPELPEDVRPGLAPLDEEVDNVRGPAAGRLILEYGSTASSMWVVTTRQACWKR